jgi:peptide/nickel transport system substrate-binding protein
LRSDVTYHNGRRLVAADVIATIGYLRSAHGKRQYMATEVAGIAAMRASGDLDLEIVTAEPDAILPKRLAALMIVEPELWTADEDKFALSPVGTGAWRLVDWGRASGRARFAAHTGGWRRIGEVKSLEVVPLPETATRLAAMKSGQVDLVEGLSPEDLDELRDQPFVTITLPSTQVMAIALRNVGNDGSPLQDRRVRQALNLAVNRPAMVELILHGQSRVAAIGCTAVTFGCDPDLAPYPYDPARARALLAEAGYEKGFALKADVLVGFGESDHLIYQQVAADLAMVGVRLEVRTPAYPTWLQRYLSNAWGDADAFSLMWDSSTYYDVIRPLKYHSCDKANPFFCAPELMPALLGSDRIMDVPARRAALFTINRQFKDAAPALWLLEQPFHYAHTRDIDSFSARPYGVLYENITFKAGTRRGETE